MINPRVAMMLMVPMMPKGVMLRLRTVEAVLAAEVTTPPLN